MAIHENTKALASGAELRTPASRVTGFTPTLTPTLTPPPAPPLYHKVPEAQSDQVDVLAQIKVNLDHLEDLQGRLRFIMGEICGLTRKKG